MVVFARVSAEPLDVAEHESAVADARVGATALFLGTVRDHDPDAIGAVVRLEYSAHPDVEATLRRIAADVAESSSAGAEGDPGVRIAVSHRIGSLRVGDLALVAAVSTAHRAEAFEVCRDLVERVKHEVPIWKKQFGSDGSSAWIGLT